MILGFKKQFHAFVKEGSKTHTIRARGRRRSFRPGDSCDCFGNPRQKSMFLLGRFPCVKVQKIRIAATGDPSIPLKVSIDGDILSPDEANMLFHRDGFREPSRHLPANPLSKYPSMCQAFEFWKDRLAAPFIGDLIHWKWSAAAGVANAVL